MKNWACIDAGNLNKRCFLQSISTTQDSQSYELAQTWTNIRGIWCSIETKSASESEEQDQQRQYERIDVTCRYAADIENNKRLLVPFNATLLNGAINAVVTSITVDDADIAPGNRAVILRINDEFMTVSAGYDSTSLTVARGAFGSTAASHSDDDSIVRYRVANIDGVQNINYANEKMLLHCVLEN